MITGGAVQNMYRQLIEVHRSTYKCEVSSQVRNTYSHWFPPSNACNFSYIKGAICSLELIWELLHRTHFSIAKFLQRQLHFYFSSNVS